MFGKNPGKKNSDTTVILWNDGYESILKKKIKIVIHEIKRFKNRLFGFQNRPSSFGFVPLPMEVHGEILGTDGAKKKVFFLVSEPIISSYSPQDKMMLWIAEDGYCFKLEKVTEQDGVKRS